MLQCKSDFKLAAGDDLEGRSRQSTQGKATSMAAAGLPEDEGEMELDDARFASASTILNIALPARLNLSPVRLAELRASLYADEVRQPDPSRHDRPSTE